MSLDRFHSAYEHLWGARVGALCLLLAFPSTRAVAGESAAGPKSAPVPKPASRAQVVSAYGKLPLSFEVNQGQSDPRVKFLSRGRGYALFLTGEEAVLSLAIASRESRVESRKSKAESPQSPPLRQASPQPQSATDDGLPTTDPIANPKSQIQNPTAPTPNPESRTPAVVRLKLLGANPSVKVAGLDELPGKTNYFLGNDPKKWRTNVPNYAKVRYENVYPGVDLVYYGGQSERSGDRGAPGRQLEYDFVVAPGGDPKAIALEIETRESGIANPKSKIDANGDFVIATDAGEVRFHKPVVYQFAPNPESRTPNPGRQFLDGRYVLRPSNPKSKIENPKYEIGFEIAGYDPSRPLIIDPTLIYSSYLGGSDTDGARFVAVDGSGNAYLIGDTTSTDFPTTPSSVQADPGGPRDVFVTMIDDAGSARVYSTYLGGSGDDTVNDYGGGIAVDSDGNAYVTGRTNSTNFPITVGAIGPFQPILGGGSDAFVTKLDPNGSALVYSTYLGGSSDDFGGGIAIDDVSRFAYVTGQTQSSNFPLQGSLQPFRGSSDAFVASLNATGSALNYSTYLGGSAGDFGFGIALDGSGNAYVTGRTLSSDFPTPNAFQATAGGSGDAFVTKVAAGGTSLLYSSYLGGSDTDGGVGIAVDTPGNAYVAGWTYSSNFPKVNPLQGALAGDRDAFIAKVNPAGSALVYSTFVGGTADDVGYSIAVDSFRNAYVTGYTSSTNFPTASPLYGTNAGGLDAFVAKVNSAGSALIFSTYLGGSGDDSGAGIAVDSSGAYVTGTTASINFPTTIGAYDTGCGTDVPPTCNAGKNDAFVAKLTGLALPVVTLSPASLDFGNLAVGSTSAPRTVTLANDGDEALTLTGLAVQLSLTDPTPSPDFVESDKCGASLAAGASCTLSVLFAPTAAGIRTAVVVIDDNAAGSPHGVDLTGDGVAVSAVDLSTRFLSFGDQLVGTTSAPQAVRLTNTGSAALRISSINASGDFAQTSRCGTSLAASASCDISVTFTPGSPGLIDGFLTITDDAPGSPHEVSLSGTGIVGPVVRLSPTSLTFANQFVGTTSAAQTLTLTNGGTATLNITSIVASGDFAQTNTCGSSVAAGANCTISVTFTPTVAGSRTGAVTITDNATGSPHVVSLSGTGIVGPGVGLSPRSVNFPGNPLNIDCPSKAVTLTNTGDAPLAITSIVASANFSETNTCGTSLAGGASCVISVKFHPTVVGVTAGTLTITTNAADSPHTVALTGNGTPACRLLTSVRSATVLRGTDSTSFGVSDASPSCSPVPIELSCRLENPAACALQPATIPPSGNSTLKVSNLRAVAAELVTVVVEAVSEFRRTSESLTVLISDFAFARAPERATVRAGEATSYALAIRPVNGLEGTVRLSCSGAPQGARCTVTPSAVELDGSRLGQATVRVETTARALVGPGGEWQPPVPSLPRGLPLLLGLMSLAVLATLTLTRSGRRVWLALSVSLLLVLVWAACGGGGGSLVSTSPGSGTPAGTYTLMITGNYTAPSTGAELTHDTTVDLTVN